MADNPDILPRIRTGDLKIEVVFDKPASVNVDIIVLAETLAMFKIDNNRGVSKNFP